MKKTLILTFLIIVLLLAACKPSIVADGGRVVHGECPTPAASYDVEDIVYVTKSGTKYHTADCSHLAKSCIPITREQALAEGREPCSCCHPDDPGE